MEKQQNIFTLDHKGITIIEIVVVIGIISILSVVTITSFSTLVKKNRTKLFEEEALMIYYNFVETINEFKNYKLIKNGSTYQYCIYPYRALVTSGSGEYLDDFDYDNFNKIFLGCVFEGNDEFKNGNLEYNLASYTSSSSTAYSTIKYIVPSKGVIKLDVMMKDGNYTNYDTLTIMSITYSDLLGNSKTFQI